jgi:hypothetical protein
MASSPRRIASQPPPSPATNIFLFLVAFRLLNALAVRTFFQPDEFFQSLEPAWQIAFGKGQGAWVTWVCWYCSSQRTIVELIANRVDVWISTGMAPPTPILLAPVILRRRLQSCKLPCDCPTSLFRDTRRTPDRRTEDRAGRDRGDRRLLYLETSYARLREGFSWRMDNVNRHSPQSLAVVLLNKDPVKLR